MEARGGKGRKLVRFETRPGAAHRQGDSGARDAVQGGRNPQGAHSRTRSAQGGQETGWLTTRACHVPYMTGASCVTNRKATPMVYHGPYEAPREVKVKNYEITFEWPNGAWTWIDVEANDYHQAMLIGLD